MDGFVHLHVHSHYSLLDGAAPVEALAERAAELGMPALAVTDHGNLFGAMEFYTAAREAGIKPILGMEAYISPTSRHDRSMGSISDASFHLLLLAADATGWANLMSLSSRAYLEGFYYRPRIDLELLSQLNAGLICTSACLGGQIPQALLAGKYDQAAALAGTYRDIFGPDRFYLEVQNQGLADQDKVNSELIRLAKQLGLGIVGTNDVHFLKRDDKAAHEILTCISTGKTLAGGGAIPYSPQLYLKSPDEMRRSLAGLADAADTTLKIAEMCNVELALGKPHLPAFATPPGISADQHIRSLAEAGLGRRFAGRDMPAEYRDRLDRELTVIADKGYSSYFLVVNDFVQYARSNNIPAAPRGSGVATLLGYALGIADVDPLKYGLLFERFTDPQREEAPDIDIDICQEGRQRLIQYVREKYGHVAQIITYGTLKARAAIRDVGRVLDLPLAEVDAICKLVPEGPKTTLDSALSAEPDLRRRYESDPRVREVIDYAKTLEGLARHAGVHAGGVIVCDQPLEQLVPLCRQADSQDPITQWDGPTCEKIGLMKMDFLGLRTLTIIQRARELVHQRTGREIDPEALPLDDDDVLAVFRRAETDGIFQFESGGMRSVLAQMQPTRLEDLIAANAMYRPGPMELIPTFCARKHGREGIPSVHALVDDILAETYGIMVYQEQVMLVLNRLGKLPLNRALTLIKAISKKKESTIEAERSNFVSGAQANGISEAEAQQLFELILKFAGYGFNKAHSTRYAIVAYQSAYFKQHYPLEFLAATLTFECSDTDKVVQYLTEADRMGVKIAPPQINRCDSDFTIDGQTVRFGLSAVKGVGVKAVEAIVVARNEGGPFRDLFEFCERVDSRSANRSTIEALIKCGAFDSMGATRSAMIAALDSAIEIGQNAAAAKRSGQMGLFGGGMSEPPAPHFPKVEAWSEAQLLVAEKETLGFYITSHPLTKYARELGSLSWPAGINLAALAERSAGPVCIGCMISSIRPTATKNGPRAGQRMAMLTLEDTSGKCDAVAFPEAFEQFGHLIRGEAMVFIAGQLDRRRELPSIVIEQIIPIDEAIETLTASLLLRVPIILTDKQGLGRISEVLQRHKGNTDVTLELTPRNRDDARVQVKLDASKFVKPSPALLAELSDLLAADNVVLEGRPAPPQLAAMAETATGTINATTAQPAPPDPRRGRSLGRPSHARVSGLRNWLFQPLTLSETWLDFAYSTEFWQPVALLRGPAWPSTPEWGVL